MGTELEEKDALIESYISFVQARHNRAKMNSRTDTLASFSKIPTREMAEEFSEFIGPAVGASFSDIEMKLVHNYLSDDKEEGSELLEAARDDDSVRVMELLVSDPQLIWYRENDTGYTVLLEAARCGHQSTVKELIDFIKNHKDSTFKFESPLQETGRDYNTPLHVALEHGHKQVASLLIKEMLPHIAFSQNHSGETPVELAIRAGYKDMLEEMLQRAPWSSLSQYTRDQLMRSRILHDAIEKRNLGLLKIVLEKMPALIGTGPLEYAAYNGYLEEVRYMLDNFPGSENCANNNGRFPIHSAVAGNHLDIVKEILSHYPNAMDHVDRKGRRPLSLAAHLGHLDQVCYFLTNFPNYANKCDEDGSFPIHKAVAGGYVNIVKQFITRCPETVSQVNREGRSILHLIVEYAKADVLSYLKSIPEVEQIYQLRDAKGYTFFDLAKKQMRDWEERQNRTAEFQEQTSKGPRESRQMRNWEKSEATSRVLRTRPRG